MKIAKNNIFNRIYFYIYGRPISKLYQILMIIIKLALSALVIYGACIVFHYDPDLKSSTNKVYVILSMLYILTSLLSFTWLRQAIQEGKAPISPSYIFRRDFAKAKNLKQICECVYKNVSIESLFYVFLYWTVLAILGTAFMLIEIIISILGSMERIVKAIETMMKNKAVVSVIVSLKKLNEIETKPQVAKDILEEINKNKDKK